MTEHPVIIGDTFFKQEQDTVAIYQVPSPQIAYLSAVGSVTVLWFGGIRNLEKFLTYELPIAKTYAQ